MAPWYLVVSSRSQTHLPQDLAVCSASLTDAEHSVALTHQIKVTQYHSQAASLFVINLYYLCIAHSLHIDNKL